MESEMNMRSFSAWQFGDTPIDDEKYCCNKTKMKQITIIQYVHSNATQMGIPQSAVKIYTHTDVRHAHAKTSDANHKNQKIVI